MTKSKKMLKSLAVAALATSAIVPVASANTATTYSDIVTTVNGQLTSITQDQYNLAVALGKIPTVEYVKVNNKFYSIAEYNLKVAIVGAAQAFEELAKTGTAVSITPLVGAVDGSGNITNNTPVTGELKVESVSAINANEIQVKFNNAVNGNSAIRNLDGTYVITINNEKYGDPTVGYTTISSLIEDVELTDEKTVTFKLKDSKVLAHGDKYGVDVKDSVLSADGNKKIERYADTQKIFNDLVAPTLVDTKYADKNVTLTFNEPLLTSPADFEITIDGVEVPASALKNSGQVLDYSYEINLEDLEDEAKAAGADLLKEGSHAITLFNTRDHVKNNANVGNRVAIINTTYTVESVQNQPAVKAITPIDFNSFLVTFNKPVTEAKITVTKGNTTFHDKVDTGFGTSAVIHLPLSATSVTNGLTYLYDANATSTAVSIQVKDYKDKDSVYGNTYNGSTTLKLDDVKPRSLSGKIGASHLEIQLNRSQETDIDYVALKAADKAKIKVTDKNGTVRTIDASNTLLNESNGVLTVALDGFTTTGAGNTAKYSDFAPFKVEVAKDAITYKTDKIDITSPKTFTPAVDFTAGQFYSELKNDAFTTVIATTTSAYKVIEAVGTGSNGAAAPTASNNVITVNYIKEMGPTATDVGNYTLNGQRLPDGSTATIDGTSKKVTITLPEGTFKSNEQRALIISTNVKTKDDESVVGNIASKEEYQSALLTFNDNTKPVLEKAQFVLANSEDTKTNTIKLTFSENVKGDATDKNFVIIAHDGTKLAVVDPTNISTPTKDLVLTLAGDKTVSTTQTIKVQVVPQSVSGDAQGLTDTSTNKLTEGTEIVVSGKIVGTIDPVTVARGAAVEAATEAVEAAVAAVEAATAKLAAATTANDTAATAAAEAAKANAEAAKAAAEAAKANAEAATTVAAAEAATAAATAAASNAKAAAAAADAIVVNEQEKGEEPVTLAEIEKTVVTDIAGTAFAVAIPLADLQAKISGATTDSIVVLTFEDGTTAELEFNASLGAFTNLKVAQTKEAAIKAAKVTLK